MDLRKYAGVLALSGLAATVWIERAAASSDTEMEEEVRDPDAASQRDRDLRKRERRRKAQSEVLQGERELTRALDQLTVDGQYADHHADPFGPEEPALTKLFHLNGERLFATQTLISHTPKSPTKTKKSQKSEAKKLRTLKKLRATQPYLEDAP